MKVNIPGLHNSGEDHWQSHFENDKPSEFKRIIQENWSQPDCHTWIEKMEKDLKNENYSELILIGHSIGCMAIVNWIEKYHHVIKGALLVAPSDADKPVYPDYITGFSPVPMARLPFPSILVASSDDHVTDIERSKEFADHWGSELIILENAGHIEPSSGFGKWEQGMELVHRLE